MACRLSAARLRGSLDLDAAWQQLDPHANRWDCALADQHTNREPEFLYWVETHTANESQVNCVIRTDFAKALRELLRANHSD